MHTHCRRSISSKDANAERGDRSTATAAAAAALTWQNVHTVQQNRTTVQHLDPQVVSEEGCALEDVADFFFRSFFPKHNSIA